MPAYTPPSLDAVNFALGTSTPASVEPYASELSPVVPAAVDAADFALEPYTQPVFNEIAFNLSASFTPDSPPSNGGTSTTYTIPAGLTLSQKKGLAALLACQPCCAGSGSGSGRRTPNGCAGCPCCECSCWWATGWHKAITKDNLLRGPLAAPDWTLTSNTITQVGGDPDEMFLGDVASDTSQCTIGGLATIDGNGDIIGNVDDPAYPRWEGDLIYTDGMVTTTLHVVIKLQFTLSWTCDGATVPDSFTWSGTTITVTDGPGIDLNTEVPDYYPIADGNYGLEGTLTNCSGTIVLEGVSSGIVLPDLVLEMISDPNCSGSGA